MSLQTVDSESVTLQECKGHRYDTPWLGDIDMEQDGPALKGQTCFCC